MLKYHVIKTRTATNFLSLSTSMTPTYAHSLSLLQPFHSFPHSILCSVFLPLSLSLFFSLSCSLHLFLSTHLYISLFLSLLLFHSLSLSHTLALHILILPDSLSLLLSISSSSQTLSCSL